MTGVIYTESFPAPPVDFSEILRYAGVKGEDETLRALAESCVKETQGKLTYKVCWREFPVKIEENTVDFGFAGVRSAALAKNLLGCGRAVIFAATVGVEMDRLIVRASRLSPVKALMLDAIGGERVEALCDAFNEKIKAKEKTRPRFSPGYGDLPLDFQKEIFRVLDCPRKIGVTLNDSLLMSPTKSVTAIIGVEGEK